MATTYINPCGVYAREEKALAPRRSPKKTVEGALGGLAAEELVFGEASTGPSSDIQQVTRIARAMVTRWGMSKKLGPRTFGKAEELVFLGREISETRDYSEKVAESIDDEVRTLIDDAHEVATSILKEHRAPTCSWKSRRLKGKR